MKETEEDSNRMDRISRIKERKKVKVKEGMTIGSVSISWLFSSCLYPVHPVYPC
jgi:hypothetical protein